MLPNVKLAHLLIGKADKDEQVLRILLASPEAPYEAIGFHAQQAVEKLIKAVLAARSVRYRRVHDILELIDLLNDNGIPFPETLEEVKRLNPFAVDYRYDEFLPGGPAPFERATMLTLVEETRAWAERMVSHG